VRKFFGGAHNTALFELDNKGPNYGKYTSVIDYATVTNDHSKIRTKFENKAEPESVLAFYLSESMVEITGKSKK
jgi:hypothetical protein